MRYASNDEAGCVTLRSTPIAFLILIVISVYAVPVSAANVTITFDNGQVQARMNLSLHQNMTTFPNKVTTLNATSDPTITSAINRAFKDANSSASISTMTIGVSSAPSWLNLTLQMNVGGVTGKIGDIAYANLTWRTFRTLEDFRTDNFSYNTVGSRYFRPVLDFYVNASENEANPNATIQGVTFFVNGTQSVAGITEADQVGNFTLLDFRPLSQPLDKWNQTYSLTNNTSTWRYNPPTILNDSVRVTQANKTFTIFSLYSYNAQIQANGLVQAHGDVLRADVGSGQSEWIMASVVVLAIILALAVQIMFRRKRKAVRLGRR
jgi:hypothetical protein